MRIGMRTGWCGFLGLTMAALVACGGADARKAEYLERGRQLVQEGNHDKARLELKNVLQIDPAHVEARYLLATVDESDQRWQDAFVNYREVVDLDPAHVEARIKLGRLYLSGSVPDKAIEMADGVLEREPRNLDALLLKAGAMLRRNSLEEATRLAEAALEIDAGHAEAIALLATCYYREKRFDSVAEVLRRGVQANPSHSGLRMLLAQLHVEQQQPDKATELLEELVRLEPRNLQYRLSLVALHVQAARLDDAEGVLRAAVAQEPGNTAAALALLGFLAQHRDVDVLKKEIAARIAATRQEFELRFGIAQLYEKLGMREELKEGYRAIIEKDATGPFGRAARSELALQLAREERIAEAEALVAEALRSNARDTTALMARGQIALMKRDLAAAIADFRSVLRERPDFSDALRLLARAHLLRGERDLARESLSKAVEVKPQEPESRLELARLLLESGDRNGAWNQVQSGLKVAPQHRAMLQLAVRIAMAGRDWTGALEAATALKTHHPDDPLGHVLAGIIYQAQDQVAASSVEFEQALEKRPEAALPMTALVANDVARNDFDKARERVLGFIERHPGSATAHNLLGELLLLRQDVKGAEQAFEQAIALNRQWPVAYRNLARARAGRGDTAGAVKVYQDATGQRPDDVTLAFELAVAYEQNGDPDAAIRQYEWLLQRAPKLEPAVNNLAMLLALYRDDQASLDRALDLAQRLASVKHPSYLDTLAWVHYRKENYEAAIPLLEASLRLQPAPMTNYHLGMAYYRKGDRDAARRHLSRAVEGGEDFPGKDEARKMLARL